MGSKGEEKSLEEPAKEEKITMEQRKEQARENHKEELRPERADWMGRMKPETPIWKLKIPGSHDTASFAIQGTPSFFGIEIDSHRGVTQFLNLEKQLALGARYFDIRVDNYDDDCHVGTGHYVMRADYCFEQLMNDLVAFLKAHPTEVVFLRIKEAKGVLGAFERFWNWLTGNGINKKVQQVLDDHQHFLCSTKYKTLRDFQRNNKRICLINSASRQFLPEDKQEDFVFEDILTSSAQPPEIFKKPLPERREGHITKTRMSTFSWVAQPIYPADEQFVRDDPQAKDWFNKNLQNMNIVSFDFIGEKRNFITTMMRENEQFEKPVEEEKPQNEKAPAKKRWPRQRNKDTFEFTKGERPPQETSKRFLASQEQTDHFSKIVFISVAIFVYSLLGFRFKRN